MFSGASQPAKKPLFGLTINRGETQTKETGLTESKESLTSSPLEMTEPTEPEVDHGEDEIETLVFALPTKEFTHRVEHVDESSDSFDEIKEEESSDQVKLIETKVHAKEENQNFGSLLVQKIKNNEDQGQEIAR